MRFAWSLLRRILGFPGILLFASADLRYRSGLLLLRFAFLSRLITALAIRRLLILVPVFLFVLSCNNTGGRFLLIPFVASAGRRRCPSIQSRLFLLPPPLEFGFNLSRFLPLALLFLNLQNSHRRRLVLSLQLCVPLATLNLEQGNGSAGVVDR